MKILHVPQNILAKKVKTIPLKRVKMPQNSTEVIFELPDSLKKTIQDMKSTLLAAKNPEGVGLAGNQVGLDMAIFLMHPEKKSPITVCINPKVLHSSSKSKAPTTKKTSKSKNFEALEGCLSIPRIWGQVDREPHVELTYIDENGNQITRIFDDFEAVIVQHEMDHLNGVVFTQRVLEQGYVLAKEDEKGHLHEYSI